MTRSTDDILAEIEASPYAPGPRTQQMMDAFEQARQIMEGAEVGPTLTAAACYIGFLIAASQMIPHTKSDMRPIEEHLLIVHALIRKSYSSTLSTLQQSPHAPRMQ